MSDAICKINNPTSGCKYFERRDIPFLVSNVRQRPLNFLPQTFRVRQIISRPSDLYCLMLLPSRPSSCER